MHTAQVVVDPVAGNLIASGPNGLVATETPLVVTVNGTATAVNVGGNDHTIDIMTLSSDANNALMLGGDGGLYYSPSISGDVFLQSSSFENTTNLLSLTLSDGNTITANLADLVDTYDLTVADSSTVDLTLTGAGTTASPWNVTAQVLVDPAGGLTAGAGGLAIDVDPAGDITVGPNGLLFNHNPSSVSGPVAGVWTHADGAGNTTPIASTSTDANNLLTVGGNGGSQLSPFPVSTLTDVNTVGATAGQVLGWNGTEWVPLSVSFTDTDTTYTVSDSTTVDLTLSATNDIAGTVILDPNANNWLTAGPNGLIVTCLLYTSPSPRDGLLSRMPSSA